MYIYLILAFVFPSTLTLAGNFKLQVNYKDIEGSRVEFFDNFFQSRRVSKTQYLKHLWWRVFAKLVNDYKNCLRLLYRFTYFIAPALDIYLLKVSNRNSLSVSVSVSLFLSLSLCLCLCLSLSLCLFLYLSVSLCVSLSLSLSLCLCLSVPLSLSLPVSLCLSLSLSLMYMFRPSQGSSIRLGWTNRDQLMLPECFKQGAELRQYILYTCIRFFLWTRIKHSSIY